MYIYGAFPHTEEESITVNGLFSSSFSLHIFIMIFPYSHSYLITLIVPATAALFSRQVTNVGNVGEIIDAKVSSGTLPDLAVQFL